MSKSVSAFAKGAHPGYYRLAVREPFRLLFVIGSLLGIFGVLLWPMNHFGLIDFYPNVIHERIMMQTFITCFVIGFLGTALPRLLDVPRLTGFETPVFAVLMVMIAFLHFRQMTFWGDILFVMTMVSFGFALIFRALFRKDIPPPGFILVPMGILSGILGTFILAVSKVTPLEPFLYQFARLLLTQGYLILPVMGIGAFLLPRFFGMPSKHDFPESDSIPSGWKSKAAFSFLCGLLLIAGFALEALGHIRSGSFLRGIVILTYFLIEMDLSKNWKAAGTLALVLRFSLFCFPAGLFSAALDPTHRLGLMHIFFIGGFGLLTYTVATRVVLGHSGHSDKLPGRIGVMTLFFILTILVIVTRVTADFVPAVRLSHYDYAAIFWSVAIGCWLIKYLPLMNQVDQE